MIFSNVNDRFPTKRILVIKADGLSHKLETAPNLKAMQKIVGGVEPISFGRPKCAESRLQQGCSVQGSATSKARLPNDY